MSSRHTRPRRQRIAAWPAGAPGPDDVAARARYTGSAEHKGHPSDLGPPALRSDATPCEPARTRNVERNTEALREGIRRGCVGAEFEGDFPRFVWTWIEGALYQARLTNRELGTYKGWRIEPIEHPDDPEGRLRWS